MIDHPQYAMWKQKLDEEYAWAEQRRVMQEHQNAANMAYLERLHADNDRRDALRKQWQAWKDERLPWWDLVGRWERSRSLYPWHF